MGGNMLNEEQFPTMKPVGEEKNEISAKKVYLSKVTVEPLFEEYVDFETFSKSDFRVLKVLDCEPVPKSKKLLKFTLNDGSGKERIILSGIHDRYEPKDLIGRKLLAITNLPPRKMMGIASEGMIVATIAKEGEDEILNLVIIDDNVPAGSKLY